MSIGGYSFEDERYISEKSLREQDIKDREQDREQRKEYANKIYKFILGWSFFLGFILIFNNIEINYKSFNFKSFSLSDTVIITLLTTTFIEVLGLFWFVMSYLFNSNGKLK